MKFRWETEFKETEIGEIPRDWEVKPLGDNSLFKIIMGQSPPSEFYNQNKIGIPFVQGKSEFGEVYVDTKTYTTKCYKIAPSNSVLITVRAPVGELNLSKDNICIGRGVASLSFKNHDVLKNQFLYYSLKQLREQLSMIGERGTTYDSVTIEELTNFQIPLPPPSEQSRIATVLAWFDDLIENKKRQNEILEKVAMAVFKNWFIDFEPFKDGEFIYNEDLGKEIPKGWEVKSIGEIAKIKSGGNAPQKENFFTDGKYPFVRVKHMSKGVCVEGCDFINEKAIKNYKLKIFSEGSLIIQKSGESLKKARVNIIPFKACIVNHLAIFDASLNKYILDLLYCNLKQTLEEIIKGEAGTTLPYLKISDVQNILLVLPPPPILQSFHSLVEPIFQKIILNQKQIMLLRKIRDRLLPLLVSGKLRVEEI